MYYPLRIMLVMLSAVLYLACGTTDPKEEEIKSGGTITVAGDLNESFAVDAGYTTAAYDDGNITKQYFTIILLPRQPGANPLAMSLLFKSGASLPQAGTYTIGGFAFGDDIPVGSFGSSYSGRNVTDFSSYQMHSGNLTLTDVSSKKVSGHYEASGYYADFIDVDSSRTVTINAEFVAIPLPY
ncbi:MAG: hypothetical protein E4H13_09435 [Calditrichales bacterium]|nr:MAG: hypothetical protein E4H13_09435 [Calditrichales bacterium]